jgi:hypothetical protein
MIFFLLLIIILISVLHYYLCYLFARKEDNFQNNIDYVKEIILEKTSRPFLSIKEIESKYFWLYFFCYGTKIGLILEAADHIMWHFFATSANYFTEIICIIICSLIFFIIAEILGFVITMFLLKRKYIKNY